MGSLGDAAKRHHIVELNFRYIACYIPAQRCPQMVELQTLLDITNKMRAAPSIAIGTKQGTQLHTHIVLRIEINDTHIQCFEKKVHVKHIPHKSITFQNAIAELLQCRKLSINRDLVIQITGPIQNVVQPPSIVVTKLRQEQLGIRLPEAPRQVSGFLNRQRLAVHDTCQIECMKQQIISHVSSLSQRSAFKALQLLQRICRFPAVVRPPAFIGRMWSTCI